MRVYLVRHGEALPEELDPERGLSEAGRKDVEKVASFLKGLSIEVEEIQESGKKRATQTAEIMASAVVSRQGIVRRPGLAPLDPVEPIAKDIAALQDDIMLVGHLPFLSRLASMLILGQQAPEVVRLGASALVCLERGSEGRWTVAWMIGPGLL